MIRKRRKQLLNLYVVSDVLAIILAFHVTYWLRFVSGVINAPKGVPDYWHYLLIVPVLVLLHLIYFSYQGYYSSKLRRNRLDDLFLVLLNSIVTSLLILFIFSYLKSYQYVSFEVSHGFLLFYVPWSVLLIFCFRLAIFNAFRVFFLSRNGVSNILIAGSGELALTIAENLKKYRHFGLEVKGFLSHENHPGVLGGFNDLEKIVKNEKITDLFIALSLKEYKTIMKLIETANQLYLDVKLVPDILQIASLKSGIEHLEGIPIINLGDIPLQGWRALLKRLFDLVFSIVGILVFSPFFILLPLVIKLNSKGSVFYRQTRVGLDGRHFKMIKFRTMKENAEQETGAVWSPSGDTRVTGIGKFLRKFSLDEIPQFFNVLRGDMSLVGPRPERPEFVDKFKHNIPNYILRHKVKTGMTGWAQVHGLRGNTPLDKRIEYDIYYIQNWTLKLDLEIIWRTVLKFQFIDKEKVRP